MFRREHARSPLPPQEFRRPPHPQPPRQPRPPPRLHPSLQSRPTPPPEPRSPSQFGRRSLGFHRSRPEVGRKFSRGPSRATRGMRPLPVRFRRNRPSVVQNRPPPRYPSPWTSTTMNHPSANPGAGLQNHRLPRNQPSAAQNRSPPRYPSPWTSTTMNHPSANPGAGQQNHPRKAARAGSSMKPLPDHLPPDRIDLGRSAYPPRTKMKFLGQAAVGPTGSMTPIHPRRNAASEPKP